MSRGNETVEKDESVAGGECECDGDGDVLTIYKVSEKCRRGQVAAGSERERETWPLDSSGIPG